MNAAFPRNLPEFLKRFPGGQIGCRTCRRRQRNVAGETRRQRERRVERRLAESARRNDV